jgi:methylmalonyl-CoA mutase
MQTFTIIIIGVNLDFHHLPNKITVQNQLFSDFDPTSKHQWEEQIKKDLKIESLDKLIKTTKEGTFYPIYTEEDVHEHAQLMEALSEGLLQEEIPQLGARVWENRAEVVVSDFKKANKEALQLLNQGADGILFSITDMSPIDMNILLKDIGLQYCNVSFSASPLQAASLFESYANYVKSNHYNPAQIKGDLLIDPFAHYSLSGTATAWTAWLNLWTQNDLPQFRTLCISGQELVNSGASIPSEIGLMLNKWAEVMELASANKFSLERLMRNTVFYTAIGKRFLKEIGKLRALRVLAVKMAEHHRINLNAADIRIATITSRWTKTRYDKHVNLLRSSTECMAAILGGCQSVQVLPFDLFEQENTSLARRMALNTPIILREESYLNQNADPVAGSYTIEGISQTLMRSSWDFFLSVEKAGGWLAYFESGQLGARIKQEQSEAHKAVAQRKDIYVGSNQYADAHEVSTLFEFPSSSQDSRLLKISNATEEIERLRNCTEKAIALGAKRPQFINLLFDTDSMSKARSTFALNYMSCAGFAMAEEIIIKNTPEREWTSSSADFIILCGSDEDYLQKLPSLLSSQAFANAKDRLILAGLPQNSAELQASGVQDFIHRQSDLIAQLSAFQQKLNIQ